MSQTLQSLPGYFICISTILTFLGQHMAGDPSPGDDAEAD